MTTITIDELVPKIEAALKVVSAKSADHGITLTIAEVELFASGDWTGEGGLKIEFLVEVDVGAKQQRSHGQTLSLKLTPKGGALKLGKDESNELAEAILSLALAIKRASTSALFLVKDGTVVVEFGVTTTGKLKIVAGGGERQTKGVHKMKLTFVPTP
jgi:hypothetical protein